MRCRHISSRCYPDSLGVAGMATCGPAMESALARGAIDHLHQYGRRCSELASPGPTPGRSAPATRMDRTIAPTRRKMRDRRSQRLSSGNFLSSASVDHRHIPDESARSSACAVIGIGPGSTIECLLSAWAGPAVSAGTRGSPWPAAYVRGTRGCPGPPGPGGQRRPGWPVWRWVRQIPG